MNERSNCSVHQYNLKASNHFLQKGQCKFNKNYIGAKESGVVAIKYGSESDLKAAVALNGPISVAVDARSSAFRVSFCTPFDITSIHSYIH